MARSPDERIKEAHKMYKKGIKLVEIASQLNLPAGTVRRWKSTHNWDNERSDNKANVRKRKKGGQPGNTNGTGPPGNKNAEKYGFLSKYLPPETLEIFNETKRADPLDLLWHQIQIAYAAIVRAQQIAYVKNQQDKTINKSGQKDGDTVTEERWEVQKAWDKQENFLKAQARAQSELRSMIKQYDEMLHNDWELATEEQKVRIEQMRISIKTQQGGNDGTDGIQEFIKATKPTQEDINALYADEVTDDDQKKEE